MDISLNDMIEGGVGLVMIGFVSWLLWTLCFGPDHAWPLRRGAREGRDANYRSLVLILFAFLGVLLGGTAMRIGQELGAPEVFERWAGAFAGICLGLVAAIVAGEKIWSDSIDAAAGRKNPVIYWLCLPIIGAVFLTGVAIVVLCAGYGLRIWV